MYLDLLAFQLPECLCLRYNATLCGAWGDGNAELSISVSSCLRYSSEETKSLSVTSLGSLEDVWHMIKWLFPLS